MSLIRARISKFALEHNLSVVRNHAQGSKVWGVIKANAYGHNLDLVLPVMHPLVEGFACARFNEALRIQSILKFHNLPVKPILILGGCYEVREFSQAFDEEFQLVCHTFEQLATLRNLIFNTLESDKKIKIWLEINIGMNRLGLPINQVLEVIQALESVQSIEVIGVMAHLGTADTPDWLENKRQLQNCVQIFQQIKDKFPLLQTSLSNSAHLLSEENRVSYPYRGCESDWVRPGICLYGSSPLKDKSAESLGLKPVMTLEAKIVSIQKIKSGETVGYGATWAAPVDGQLCILALGYGDGYPRHIENTSVSYKGIRLMKAGRISMDLSAFFCPDPLADIQVGQFAEIWGEHIHVDEVAVQSNSIGYERLTQIKSRVEYSLGP